MLAGIVYRIPRLYFSEVFREDELLHCTTVCLILILITEAPPVKLSLHSSEGSEEFYPIYELQLHLSLESHTIISFLAVRIS